MMTKAPEPAPHFEDWTLPVAYDIVARLPTDADEALTVLALAEPWPTFGRRRPSWRGKGLRKAKETRYG